MSNIIPDGKMDEAMSTIEQLSDLTINIWKPKETIKERNKETIEDYRKVIKEFDKWLVKKDIAADEWIRITDDGYKINKFLKERYGS